MRVVLQDELSTQSRMRPRAASECPLTFMRLLLLQLVGRQQDEIRIEQKEEKERKNKEHGLAGLVVCHIFPLQW